MAGHKMWLVLIFALAVVRKGESLLQCHVCKGTDRTCETFNAVCDKYQDVCWSFKGRFELRDGTIYKGHLLKSCGNSTRMKNIAIKQPNMESEMCEDVTDAYDLPTAITFGGMFCMCSTDYCNNEHPCKSCKRDRVMPLP